MDKKLVIKKCDTCGHRTAGYLEDSEFCHPCHTTGKWGWLRESESLDGVAVLTSVERAG